MRSGNTQSPYLDPDLNPGGVIGPRECLVGNIANDAPGSAPPFHALVRLLVIPVPGGSRRKQLVPSALWFIRGPAAGGLPVGRLGLLYGHVHQVA